MVRGPARLGSSGCALVDIERHVTGEHMTDHSAAAVAGTGPAPGAGLEPDAIGAAQDTIIGMASSAPAATVGLSLAALAVATAYGSGPILILTAIPMLIIANAYYRRRIVSGAVDFVTVGLLPLGAAGFLGWIFVKSLGEAPWSQRWSLIGIVIAGLVVVLSARFVLRSS